MNKIEHKDIFELFSINTGLPAGEIRKIIMSIGAKNFLTNYVSTQNLLINNPDMILGSEITDANGKILINSGVPLSKYLYSLLDKYAKDDKFSASSFKINCTQKLLDMYSAEAEKMFLKALETGVFTNHRVKALLASHPDIKSDLSEIVKYMLRTPAGVNILLKVLFSYENDKKSLFDPIYMMMIAVRAISDQSAHMYMLKAGTACFLTNMWSRFAEELSEAGKNLTIKTLINDSELEQAVLTDVAHGNSIAILNTDVLKNNYFLRLLKTVRLFTDLVNDSKIGTGDLEVHKTLYEISERGYADPEITTLLGKIFLPKIKHIVLRHAYNIKKKSECEGIIWTFAGDMLPVRFICMDENCPDCGTHKTFIPKDINITARGVSLDAWAKAGVYFNCVKLSDELQHIYSRAV